ncbi:hypothetical protein Q7P36_002862 [Cladosporium allicinum]
MSRFAALKSDHEKLKSTYGVLLAVYERLKNGSASEVSELLTRIRSEDGIPSLPEDDVVLRRSMDGRQPAEYDAGLADNHDQSLAGFDSAMGLEISSYSNPGRTVGVRSAQRGATGPMSSGELKKRHRVSPPPFAQSQNPGYGQFQANRSSEQNSRSHISVSHKVLLWPAVVCHMRSSGALIVASTDLQCIARLGSRWLLQRKTSKHNKKLPCDVRVSCSTSDSESSVFPDLSAERVHEYSSAYFNTFNVLLPLLDLDIFVGGAVARFLREGYRDDDPQSVLALLVFALGQLAIEGIVGRPTSACNDETSGIRGATVERSPGLVFFNEAQRRLGMVNTKPCLEHVQIMLLQATYFEASARHLDFWSSTSAASLACMCLIKSQQIDWRSAYGDLVKRTYWVCVLQERLFDLEFRVASTGIETLEDQVPLPHFHVAWEERSSNPLSGTADASTTDGKEGSAFYFVAMLALSRLIRRADNILRDCEPSLSETELRSLSSSTPDHANAPESASHFENYSGPPTRVVGELIHQLDLWRAALPQKLQWNDSDGHNFEQVEPLSTTPLDCSFNPFQNLGPEKIDHNIEIAVAQLRTRFYHARFLICRPFIYKALHLPQLMTVDDRVKCAFAIDAACLWPLSLAPPKNKRHLVPHLFSWTQNFVAMMFVLRMCRSSHFLSDVCREGSIAEDHLESAISSIARWLEEVRQLDGVADWGMRVLGPALSS